MLAFEENFRLPLGLCKVLQYLALITISLATTQGPGSSTELKDLYGTSVHGKDNEVDENIFSDTPTSPLYEFWMRWLGVYRDLHSPYKALSCVSLPVA